MQSGKKKKQNYFRFIFHRHGYLILSRKKLDSFAVKSIFFLDFLHLYNLKIELVNYENYENKMTQKRKRQHFF